jgi:NAD+ kinase
MTASQPKILLLGDEKKGEVRRVVDRLLPWLKKRATVVDLILQRDDPIRDSEADFCLVFGGDGSILSAARRMGENQIPTLGINLGRLGFLAEATTNDVERVVELALEGRLVEEERLLMECRVEGQAEPVLVLNDVILQRKTPALIGIRATVDGSYVTTYVGDGLIVATPVGSTAYSLAAGGPVLAPDVEALVLTPLASHALPVRPLVARARDGVELVLEGEPATTVGIVVLDGQVSFDLAPGERVELSPSETRFRHLTRNEDDFFGILRRKFNWAGSPHYPKPGE